MGEGEDVEGDSLIFCYRIDDCESHRPSSRRRFGTMSQWNQSAVESSVSNPPTFRRAVSRPANASDAGGSARTDECGSGLRNSHGFGYLANSWL